MKTQLTLEIQYDPALTDPEGLASALDRLLETALSTPDLLSEYGNPVVGEFLVADGRTAATGASRASPRLVLEIRGGLLQEAYCSDPRVEIALADWDTEDSLPDEPGIQVISDGQGRPVLVAVTEYPAEKLEALFGTLTEAALRASGLERWIEPGPASTIKKRYVLYDFDADELATSMVYDTYAEAADDASQLDNVLVIPLVIEGVTIGGGEPDGEDEPCACEKPGYFCSGVPGILAHVENGRLAQGAKVERCDLCQQYPSDAAALEKLRELGYDS